MRWLVILCCVLVSFFGTTAFAQDPNDEKAKACYERGQRLYDLGNYTGAIEEFKQGYLLSGLPAFLLNMGQAYKQLGDNTNALDYYKRYLAKIETDDPTRPSVEKIIAELEASLPVDRTGPGFDSGLTQEQIKASLGPDEYNKYVTSGLTYEGYNDVKKGKRLTYIGLGILVGGLAGGAGLAIAAKNAGTDGGGGAAGAGAGTLILVGLYGGYFAASIGGKKVQEGKAKVRQTPIKAAAR